MKNIFVQTQNVKNFITTMKEAEGNLGDPSLLVFYGQAGRGKTTAARYFAAQEGWTYARALRDWSGLWMLQDLCRELQIDPIPSRKKACFEAIVSVLRKNPGSIVLIDEADKLTPANLERVRDLADETFAPFALVGENLIVHKMKSERRMWSRTLRALEFGPITAQDVLFFAKQAAEMALSAQQAELLREASEGDFRLVARDVRRLEGLWNTNRGAKISDDMVKTAIRQGLKGK